MNPIVYHACSFCNPCCILALSSRRNAKFDFPSLNRIGWEVPMVGICNSLPRILYDRGPVFPKLSVLGKIKSTPPLLERICNLVRPSFFVQHLAASTSALISIHTTLTKSECRRWFEHLFFNLLIYMEFFLVILGHTVHNKITRLVCSCRVLVYIFD